MFNAVWDAVYHDVFSRVDVLPISKQPMCVCVCVARRECEIEECEEVGLDVHTSTVPLQANQSLTVTQSSYPLSGRQATMPLSAELSTIAVLSASKACAF